MDHPVLLAAGLGLAAIGGAALVAAGLHQLRLLASTAARFDRVDSRRPA